MKDRNLNRDSLDFANGKIGSLFRALFFPTLVGMIFNSALTLIDGIFVGQGVGAEGIAAVNIVVPIFIVSTGIGLMLGIGASVIASIRLSEDNVKAARIIMTQAFAAGLVITVPVCILCMIFTGPAVYALGCSPALEENAVNYMLYLAPGLPFLFLQCAGMMLIRLDGSPKYAMGIQITAAVLNIVLDWYMIFPLGLGVAGAAAATSIACCIGGLMVLAYFIFISGKLKFYKLKLSVTSLLLTLRNIWYMVKIGFATFLTEFAMSIMMLTGNYMFMSMLGEDGVAAYAIACYLFPVVFSISNAVAQSAQPIISFNWGAHNLTRVKRAMNISLMTAAVCGIVVTLGIWLCSGSIVRAFLSPDEPAWQLAVQGLPLFATCSVFFAVNIAYIGYCQSIENALESTVYTLLRGVVFLVLCFLLLPRIAGTAGLWLAIPAAELMTFIVIIIHYVWKHYIRRHPHATA